METLIALQHGFGVALRPENLLFCALGCFWGTVVGVLPGLGPLAGLTLLLPLTFQLDPATAIILLSGIFAGAMYGGSTTSILMRIPGEAASVVTAIDGYEMARQGRAGPALAIAAIGSWAGGTASIVGLMLFAPPLAGLMLKIGPAVEFALIVLALLIVAFVSGGSRVKTAAMICLGLAVSTIGIDKITAVPRFTFDVLEFSDGLSFAAVAVGLFGVSEILLSVDRLATIKPIIPSLRSLMPTGSDMRQSAGPIGRGTLIGFVFGIVPGISHVISTFVSYSVERRLSKHPETFGRGAIAGVAGPETANNATTGSSLIPLLVLGIPALPTTAVMLSALIIHGVQPGPQLVSEHPDIFWGLIASLYVANIILLIFNLPLVGLFVNLLRLPYYYLGPTVLILCIIGIYSVSISAVDIYVMLAAGAVGYALRKFDFDVSAIILPLVLGPRLETSLRQALMISDGSYSDIAFEARYIIGAMLIIAGASYAVHKRYRSG